MKLIKNLVCTEIENGFLLFNTLNGLIDAVDQKTVEILGKWIKQDSIEPETPEESCMKLWAPGAIFASVTKRSSIKRTA